MVIVELAGGLGNQMFQYAFGRKTALKYNTELFLDLRYLENKEQQDGFTYRDFALNIFENKANILLEEDFSRADSLTNSLSSKIFRKLIPSISTFIKEETSKYHPEYLSASKNVYLRGYWQNPRYFEDIDKYLNEEFRFPRSSNKSVLEVEKLITNSKNPVAVHVRRGDYTNIPNNLAACTPDYYTKAFDYINSRVENEEYFIFSDDVAWVKENLQPPMNSLIIDHSEPAKDYEDMYLMTRCRHHIIANSSFSWWGAWLACSQNQIVIAPKTWDGRRKSEDIIDSSWKLI